MPEEKKYRVLVTRGVIINGEGVHPERDAKGRVTGKGPIVSLKGYDARAVVSAGRGEYVDKEDVKGPMRAERSALVKSE